MIRIGRIGSVPLRWFGLASLALVPALCPAIAHAQLPPAGPPGGGFGEADDKPEGVAEKAPVDLSKLIVPPTLGPWPGEQQKRFQRFSLGGSFRLRTDWLSNLHLGFHDQGAGTPFPEPITCKEGATAGSCDESIGTANLRLRLEPTYHVTEQVRVMAQLDALDNVVLGSLSNTTDTTDTTGSTADAMVWRRAWAEVETPLGLLKFGRMPAHFGLGVQDHSGGDNPFVAADDPFHRDTKFCLDCDQGDSVDRVVFSRDIPGTALSVAVGLDWISGGPSAASTPVWADRSGGQSWDLTDADDAAQWILVLGRFLDAEAWRDRIEQGRSALSYGVYLKYRTQDADLTDDTVGGAAPETLLHARGLTLYVPDVYVRYGRDDFNFEAEAVAVYGSYADAGNLTPDGGELTLAQFGGVARANWLLSDDELNLGLEVGFASGDDWEATNPGETHVSRLPAFPTGAGDDTASRFAFDSDFQVDLILFRELLGAVTNAIYVKPSLTYDVAKLATGTFRFRGQLVGSAAHLPVATPGNENFYGIELDADVGYYNEDDRFFFGISYGALLPLAAMDHPSGLFPSEEVGEATTAQTFQTRLAVRF